MGNKEYTYYANAPHNFRLTRWTPHCIDEEAGVQRGKTANPRSQGKGGAESDQNSLPSAPYMVSEA